MKEYTYFPGCSIKGTARPYESSLFEVFQKFHIALKELEDWCCCGATIYMSVDEKMAFTLAARNMALAKNNGTPIVLPCSACYLVFRKTKDYIEQYPSIKEKVGKALASIGLDISMATQIALRHPLDLLMSEVGIENIQKQIKQPLRKFKIASYYGCQIVRPYADFDDPNDPVVMDKLFDGLGATVIDYPFKTRCCGGSLTGTIEDVGLRLNYLLLNEAKKRGANCIAVICPLCQFNLEAYQQKINAINRTDISLPVLYFTQILGYALGIDEGKLGLNQMIVEPKDLLIA
ncbi:MAG: CoB--CoM heterodisulfide reductase iron-sulfur subunit B family protein [Acidobacteriota bacterium]